MLSAVHELADTLVLGVLLEEVRRRFGRYELLDHWSQGEFHHDVVVRIPVSGSNQLGSILVVATNCNGGVKEVISFDARPERSALWHWRCPEETDFSGELPPILDRALTHHWFDPCELLVSDARSELRQEFRQRQRGGGWQMISTPCDAARKC
jgi:hypothetical protein